MVWYEVLREIAQLAPLATAVGAIAILLALKTIRENDLHTLDERFKANDDKQEIRHAEVIGALTNLRDRFDRHLEWHVGANIKPNGP